MNATIISKQWPAVIISLLVALAFGIWSVLLGQDKNWDLLNYHLYNPYAFLNNRIEFDLAPAGVQSYFSPILDLIYFTAISHLSPRTVGFLIGFLQGLNFFLVYKIAIKVLKEHKHSNIYSLLLALAGVLSVGFLAEVGTVMHDSLVALFPLLSLWLVISSIDSLKQGSQRGVWALIVSAGVLAGMGIGLKLVTAIYALPICLSFLFLPVDWVRRFKLAFIFGLSVLIALFATGGYWIYEMWHLFGNPLFPQFNHYFHGELATFDDIRDTRFLPKTFFDKIFYPVIFTLDPQRAAELKYQQFSWLIAYIAVPGLLIGRAVRFFKKEADQRYWSPEAGFLLAFFCISYFLWLNIFGIYRYLIVIELLIPLLLFVVITTLFRIRYACWGAIVLIGVLTLVNLRGAPDWGHTEWADSVYRIEPNVLSTVPEPAAVYFAGQPLAWLIPALDIKSPFIQLVPNMSVSEAYWQRARILVAGRSGKSFLVFDPGLPEMLDPARAGLSRLGFSLDDNDCSQLVAFLGSARIEYSLCELRITEPK